MLKKQARYTVNSNHTETDATDHPGGHKQLT
jgi:hypothetical protein